MRSLAFAQEPHARAHMQGAKAPHACPACRAKVQTNRKPAAPAVVSAAPPLRLQSSQGRTLSASKRVGFENFLRNDFSGALPAAMTELGQAGVRSLDEQQKKDQARVICPP